MAKRAKINLMIELLREPFDTDSLPGEHEHPHRPAGTAEPTASSSAEMVGNGRSVDVKPLCPQS